MTKAAHTPGPWYADDSGPNSGNIMRARICQKTDGNREPVLICETYDNGITTRTYNHRAAVIDEANIRLIAAAPDLLAACEAMVHAAKLNDPALGAVAATLAAAAIAAAGGAK